jgi:hypothetical protein
LFVRYFDTLVPFSPGVEMGTFCTLVHFTATNSALAPAQASELLLLPE